MYNSVAVGTIKVVLCMPLPCGCTIVLVIIDTSVQYGRILHGTAGTRCDGIGREEKILPENELNNYTSFGMQETAAIWGSD